jgi:mRNA-degrading endonuclease RelE of RelBE toxin-antitoxin system
MAKKKQTFSLVFAPAVKNHLKAIESKWDSLIRTKIEEQLVHEPDVETKNRKPFRRRPTPFDADWEIRFGPDNRFRVLYKIRNEPREVYILAIGVKQGNRLLVGGEEMDI